MASRIGNREIPSSRSSHVLKLDPIPDPPPPLSRLHPLPPPFPLSSDVLINHHLMRGKEREREEGRLTFFPLSFFFISAPPSPLFVVPHLGKGFAEAAWENIITFYVLGDTGVISMFLF